MILSPLSIILVLASVTALHASEPIRLSYNLPVGSCAKYVASSTLGQSLNVMGKDVVSEVRTTLGLTLTVKERLMKSCSVQVVWTDSKLTARTLGNQEEGHADSVITVPTYGVSQSLVITPTGKVVSTTTTAANQQQAEVLDMIKATKIPDRLIIPFPSDAVTPGARWSEAIADTSAAPQGRGAVITTGTAWYTYRGIADSLGRKCWVIEITSTDLAQHGSLLGAAIEMRIDGSGNLHGVSYHDASSGLLVSSSTRLETTVVMSSTESSLQKVSVPVQSQVNVVINRTEGKGW